MEIDTSYLDAIQAIPGSTPSEKYKWIGKLIKERISVCSRLEDVVETNEIPRALAPLIQVQAARALNKKDPKDQSTYSAIAEALKSDDAMVVHRALHVNSFFDGRNPAITNVQYFFENLFPYVSLKTRTLIIKTLAIHLKPDLAAEFFNAVASTFGLEQALPLLPACDESFMYNTIIERRIVLSKKFVKTLFRKNPDFVVRYLRLSKPVPNSIRNLHKVDIYDLSEFLAMLIKKRLEAFVELYEMHEKLPPGMKLSNKCAEALLKKGWDYFQRKPQLYINLVPLKMINATRMETIFPKLFPEEVSMFKTDTALNYLKYYPQDKKLDLLLKSYSEVYGRNLLDNSNNVTVTLLRMLPTEERIRQVQIKLRTGWRAAIMNYAYTGRCYLPVKETIPEIKEEIAKTSEMESRAALLCQMLYCCRVNNDDQALLEILTYLRDRHKNEQPWFLMKVFMCLLELYDLPQLSESHWTVLTDIIVRVYVKNELAAVGGETCSKILEAGIHYKLIHDQPIDQFISFLVDLKSMRISGYWNILNKYPEYERKCLEACLALASQKCNSDKSPWQEEKSGILHDLVASIYRFNMKHVNRNTRIERMSLKDYPWLLKEIETMISKNNHHDAYVIEDFQRTLKKHEKDLFERLFPETQNSIYFIETGEALVLLKKTPENVMTNWRAYLKACQLNWNHGDTKRFVKALRWYEEIPVKFVQQCLQDLAQEKKGVCLQILALLIHGRALAKIVEPLIPSTKTIDIHEEEARATYDLTYNIIAAAKLANPPISLQLIGKFCEGDYLSTALIALISVCNRTPLMDVVSFAKTLTTQRVSVRKHGIRILHMVAPRDQLYDFLLAQWKSEDHHSIREILLSKARELFCTEPGPATWSLLSQMISTLTTKDESGLTDLVLVISCTPDEYIVDYIKLLLETIDRLAETGLVIEKVNNFVGPLLSTIDGAICNILPREFTEALLRRFLFHPEPRIAVSAGIFVRGAYLLPAEDKLDSRLQVFTNVFVDVVKNGWNVSHPKKSRYYPVNYMVHIFIEDIVRAILKGDKSEAKLIDGILKMFLTVLTPQMDPTSYLLLTFGKEQMSVTTPKEFGVKVGQKMAELTNTFSLQFVIFMSQIMVGLLGTEKFRRYDLEVTKMDVMEGLLEVGSIEAVLMALNLLTKTVKHEYVDRYDKLLMKFAEYDHPAIKSFLCDLVNRRTFEECPYDA
ncbi:uncharacterized protein LOC143185233 [Calliopsis andreniformis]|uniref:uncharacterized protein LOC143185233 n=1 Tax=Calliopsis andreniformis TaxID=337506 RepID=UPI003FCE7BC2